MGSILEQFKANGRKDPLQRFVDSLSDSSVRDSYLREFLEFSKWMKLTPDELYQLGVECQQASDPSDKMILVDKLGEYIETVLTQKTHHGDKSYSPEKGRWIKKSLVKFYAVNGITIKVDRSHKLNRITKAKVSRLRKPSKEEVAAVISVCPNFKLKSAVALSKDAGIRPSDLVQVQWKHIKDGLSSQDGFGGFILETEKTERICMPCFGVETTKYLKFWIPELERQLGRKLEDNDYIFPVLKVSTRKGEKSDPNTFDKNCNRMFKKGGVKNVTMNGLRYFFESGLETKLHKNIISKISGKGIPDSTKSYSHHDIFELLEIYRPAYDVLRVEAAYNQAELVEHRALIRKLQEKVDAQAEEIEDNRLSRQLSDQFIRDYFGNEVDEYVRKEKEKKRNG